MKKVLMIRTSLHGGGAERIISEISNNLVKNGHEVDIFLWENINVYNLDKRINIYISDMPQAFRTFHSFCLKLFGNLAYTITSPIFIYYLKKKLNIKSYDYIYIHSLASILQFLYLRRENCFNIFHSVKSELLFKNKRFLSKWKNKLMISLAGNLKNNVCVSKGIKLDLKEEFYITAETIYNPFDISHIIIESQKTNLDLTNYGKYILNIGRLDKIKNQSEVIKAFHSVKDKYDTLLILGDGPEKESIISLINELNLNEKVFLLGFVSNPYIYIKSATVVVSASLLEGFGNTIVESLILKTPVISSDCPCGPREIMLPPLDKYLYTVNSTESLIRALKLFSDHDYPIDSFDMNRFEIDIICKKYLDLK
ncbi:glycosyltransferase [Providencia stuartii]|nr:glycosyltransferase [Providencia stuartii]